MKIQTEYRGYAIEGDGTYGQKVIKPVGKGSVHLSLRGSYTTVAFAKRAIDVYLITKETSDAKAN